MSKMTWLMCARPCAAVGLILNVSEGCVSAAYNHDQLNWAPCQVKLYGQQQQHQPRRSCPSLVDYALRLRSQGQLSLR